MDELTSAVGDPSEPTEPLVPGDATLAFPKRAISLRRRALASPRRMTATFASDGEIRVVCVDLAGKLAEAVAWAQFPEADLQEQPFVPALKQVGLPSGRHCLVLPRGFVLQRFLEVPGGRPADLEALIRHQLPLLLPVDLGAVLWACTPVATRSDGMTTVRVEIVRRDAYEALLSRLGASPAAIDLVVSECWGLARLAGAMRVDCDPGTAVVVQESGVLLVVERGGELVYDRVLCAGPIDHDSLTKPRRSELLGRIAQRLAESRAELAQHLGEAPTSPPTVFALLPDGALRHEFAVVVAHAIGGVPAPALAEQAFPLGMPIELIPVLHHAAAAGEAPSLLRAAPEHPAVRRRLTRAVIEVAAIFAGIVILGAGVLTLDFVRQTSRLRRLENENRELANKTAPLEAARRRAEVRAGTADGHAHPVQVLSSLQKATDGAVLLSGLTCPDGRTVSLTGSAPDVAAVTRFLSGLSQDPAWEQIWIDQVQQRNPGEPGGVLFQLQGRLR